MSQGELQERLSRISTCWTVLRQAHGGNGPAMTAAQQLLMQRYGGAVRRYLLAALRDPAAADDLTQEFALALVRGDFRNADPQRGRFRGYVKTVLFHLVSRYRRGQAAGPRQAAEEAPEPAVFTTPADEAAEREFRQSWRDELLARTWDALADTQPTLHAVLRCRASHPDWTAAQIAAELAGRLARALTPEGVRQSLHRAREEYGDLLLDEVAHSLETPTVEAVEGELEELGLLEHVRPALARYRAAGG